VFAGTSVKPAAANMSSLFCTWLAQADAKTNMATDKRVDLTRRIVFTVLIDWYLPQTARDFRV
jgi:hypothetical protein